MCTLKSGSDPPNKERIRMVKRVNEKSSHFCRSWFPTTIKCEDENRTKEIRDYDNMFSKNSLRANNKPREWHDEFDAFMADWEKTK